MLCGKLAFSLKKIRLIFIDTIRNSENVQNSCFLSVKNKFILCDTLRKYSGSGSAAENVQTSFQIIGGWRLCVGG